jgi:hypothetical protein
MTEQKETTGPHHVVSGWANRDTFLPIETLDMACMDGAAGRVAFFTVTLLHLPWPDRRRSCATFLRELVLVDWWLLTVSAMTPRATW